MEENINSEWERKVLERFAGKSDAAEILDIAQDVATRLAVALSDLRHWLDEDDQEWFVDDLKRKVGKMAVMLDALQLRFGDAVEEEIDFLKKIEASRGEK